MRKTIVAGNWKMHTDLQTGTDLADAIVAGVRRINPPERVRVVLCPPFTHLVDVTRRVAGSSIGVGGQNLNRLQSGALTGEISGTMLKSVGCEYVIVGHSERRLQFGESDSEIGYKANAALNAKLSPIICIGETIVEREQGRTAEIIKRQLKAAIDGIFDFGIVNCVIAYEPVWAIGTGNTATPEQAEEVHVMIRECLGQLYKPSVADEVPIIYGGSVNASNAGGLFVQPNIDGALVGGASLQADAFLSIIGSAVEARLHAEAAID